MRWGAARALSCSGLPERVRERPSGEEDDSVTDESGARGVPDAPCVGRARAAERSRPMRPTKSATSRHLRDSLSSAARASSIAVRPRYAKPVMRAKIASATSSSTRVNPLARYIAGQPGEDARRIAGAGDREIDLADHGGRRVGHRLFDHQREAALVRLVARGRAHREEAARAHLGEAVFRGPRREEAMARLERAL